MINTKLMNMCMVIDKANNKVVVNEAYAVWNDKIWGEFKFM